MYHFAGKHARLLGGAAERPVSGAARAPAVDNQGPHWVLARKPPVFSLRKRSALVVRGVPRGAVNVLIMLPRQNAGCTIAPPRCKVLAEVGSLLYLPVGIDRVSAPGFSATPTHSGTEEEGYFSWRIACGNFPKRNKPMAYFSRMVISTRRLRDLLDSVSFGAMGFSAPKPRV